MSQAAHFAIDYDMNILCVLCETNGEPFGTSVIMKAPDTYDFTIMQFQWAITQHKQKHHRSDL